MTKVICDICGAEIADSSDVRVLSLTAKGSEWWDKSIFGRHKNTIGKLDLCRNCTKRIIESVGLEYENKGNVD